MIKILIFILLAYFAYRLFVERPKLLGKKAEKLKDGEYVDYEEVE